MKQHNPNRAAAQLRERRRARRDAKRAHSINSHATANGLAAAASTLRSVAKRLNLGSPSRLFKRDDAGRKAWRKPVRGGRRYTLAEFLAAVTAWSPRRADFRAVRAALVTA